MVYGLTSEVINSVSFVNYYFRMSAGEDFITSDQLKDELNQACNYRSSSSDMIKVDESAKEYKRLKSSHQGI